MNKSFAYTFTPQVAVIMAIIDGVSRTETISRASVEFDRVVAALNSGQDALDNGLSYLADSFFEQAFAEFDKAEAIRKQSKGGFQVQNGIVFRDGIPVHNVITSRILQFATNHLPFTPLFEFLKNLHENPSKRAVDELYKFLEYTNIALTPDGCFLGYKSVAADGKSKTSGTENVEVSTDGGVTWTTYVGRIPNEVGSIVRMQRNCVDEDARRHCSNGLHVGSLEYAGPGGFFNSSADRVVIVKVNPKNAVSVPEDHNAQKLRVCEYEVVANFKSSLDEPLFQSDATPFSNVVNPLPVKVETNLKNANKSLLRRCADCRKRKKASTFTGVKGKRSKCPRCGSKRTYKL